MSESGPNQRIEPPPAAKPLHLHDRAGSGIISRKDPSAAITSESPIGRTPPSLFPPIIFPEFPEIPLHVNQLVYDPVTFQLLWFDGINYIPVTDVVLPAWLQLLLNGSAPQLIVAADVINMDATTSIDLATPDLGINVDAVETNALTTDVNAPAQNQSGNGSELAWIVTDLPLSDPGGGRIWLSPA